MRDDSLRVMADDHERHIACRIASTCCVGLLTSLSDLEFGAVVRDLNVIRVTHHDLGDFEIVVRKVL